MRMAGIIKRVGQLPAASDYIEALHAANSLLDYFKIERYMVYRVIRTEVPYSIAQKDYTVGVGGNWTIERPEQILRAGFFVAGSTASPSELPMLVVHDFTEYQQIVVKLVKSNYPRVLYYQPTLFGSDPTKPLGTATLYPVPSANGTIAIYTIGTVDEFHSIDDCVLWPKGWRRMFEYNCAVELNDRHPELAQEMNASVRATAIETKGTIKAAQQTPLYIRSDPAVLVQNPRGSRPWSSTDPRGWTPY